MPEDPFSVFGPPSPPRRDVMLDVFETPMFLDESDSDSTAITVGGYFADTLRKIWEQSLLTDRGVEYVLEVTRALCDAGIARDGDHAYDLVSEALEAWKESHG